jgi:hypothetical protein
VYQRAVMRPPGAALRRDNRQVIDVRRKNLHSSIAADVKPCAYPIKIIDFIELS